MVNEDRVKEFFQMAVFDQQEEPRYRQMGEYYKSDYIGKELIKSFFTGTFAFLLIVLFQILGSMEEFLEKLNDISWMGYLMRGGFAYVGFMMAYLLITSLVYRVRYRYGRRKLRNYYGHLKNVNREYERETKLKS